MKTITVSDATSFNASQALHDLIAANPVESIYVGAILLMVAIPAFNWVMDRIL